MVKLIGLVILISVRGKFKDDRLKSRIQTDFVPFLIATMSALEQTFISHNQRDPCI